jgi:hypothetical protein
LPTHVILVHWRVDCSPICPLRDEELEDELHTFFKCPQICDSWTAASLNAVMQCHLQNVVSVAEMLSGVCSKEDSNMAGRVAMHIWCLAKP